ncbi:hypothetical protein [Burkholderia ubonensis]|uniref:hypothetical protein n=1 Tax=Burkholderia ubonensis TaxID=101571 RepID=UPI0018E03BC9|nr:hypothetical protein [Burkholderia ubonensis]
MNRPERNRSKSVKWLKHADGVTFETSAPKPLDNEFHIAFAQKNKNADRQDVVRIRGVFDGSGGQRVRLCATAF